MRKIKCAKLDYLISKGALKFLGIFMLAYVVLFVILNRSQERMPAHFGVLYLVFAALAVVSNPFFMQTDFMSILPVTVNDRVFGRYLYGTALITASAVLGFVISAAILLVHGTAIDMGLVMVSILILGIGLFAMATEFLIFYLCEIKNAQVMSLLRMIPAFLLFFGGNYVAERVIGAGTLPPVVLWMLENGGLVAVTGLICGILAVIVCAIIASVREGKKY